MSCIAPITSRRMPADELEREPDIILRLEQLIIPTELIYRAAHSVQKPRESLRRRGYFAATDSGFTGSGHGYVDVNEPDAT
ncbi:hypothetical protein B0H19DRAFT_1245529 [Mycena capillaripes]|nr:hypothetical protein B0H19DRAFT_1245529 [Mycena capillaripes]